MGYEQLTEDYINTIAIKPFIPLTKQVNYAIVAALFTILLGSAALIVAYTKKWNFVPKFFCYTLLSVITSMLFAFTTIFTSNSLGVYV